MKIPLSLCALILAASPAFAEVTIEKSPAGAVIKIDGQLFTEYVTLSGTKPILWPIIGPTGQRMTRDYPMGKNAAETADHPHHRSLWFSYDKVNDVNFWAEPSSLTKPDADPAKDDPTLGIQKHREFTKLEGGADAGRLTSITDWVTRDGKKVLEDERRITFRGADGVRIIDFKIELKATEGSVHFGDSKEGVFGVRIPTSMDVEQKLNKAAEPGHIVNSEGLKDADAWGKPAAWVDYHGKVGEEHLGIAILNHPKSFRYPTPWHVRTYGLFAANCFGLQTFDKAAKPGDYDLAKGESLVFRYRVIFHRGDEKEGRIAEEFAEFAKED
jgi:hypothetical protein